MKRRPPEKSSWKDASEMKAKAKFKLIFYKVSIHDDPKKLIKLEMVFPNARYNTKGQQNTVEINRKSEDWLINELERRMLLNPAFDAWQVAFLIDNQSTGYPQKILRYYEKVLTGNPRRISSDDWGLATKKMHEILTNKVTS
tara:strand:+ start:8575 stop:9000 length:426 start_codon:yes stop_codon:yes gene_type:complete